MSDWDAKRPGAMKPLPPPQNIIHETPYRGYRIVCTDDPNLVGQQYPDKWGFTTDRGFVVLDDFEENVFPVGMHWFYTPEDAAAAIEMLDTILPIIKTRVPATSLRHEFFLMQQYRREFWSVYAALQKIDSACDDAQQGLDENRAATNIKAILHNLRQNVAQSRSIDHE